MLGSPPARMQSSPPGWHDIPRLWDAKFNLDLPWLLGEGVIQWIYDMDLKNWKTYLPKTSQEQSIQWQAGRGYKSFGYDLRNIDFVEV